MLLTVRVGSQGNRQLHDGGYRGYLFINNLTGGKDTPGLRLPLVKEYGCQQLLHLLQDLLDGDVLPHSVLLVQEAGVGQQHSCINDDLQMAFCWGAQPIRLQYIVHQQHQGAVSSVV